MVYKKKQRKKNMYKLLSIYLQFANEQDKNLLFYEENHYQPRNHKVFHFIKIFVSRMNPLPELTHRVLYITHTNIHTQRIPNICIEKKTTQKNQQSNIHGVFPHIIEDLINYEYASIIKN